MKFSGCKYLMTSSWGGVSFSSSYVFFVSWTLDLRPARPNLPDVGTIVICMLPLGLGSPLDLARWQFYHHKFTIRDSASSMHLRTLGPL